MPVMQFFVNEREASDSSRMLCKTFLMIIGLKTLSCKGLFIKRHQENSELHEYLELSARTCDAHRRLITNDLGSYHGNSFTLCGINLSRHDATTRFVLGQAKLAKPTSGPGAKIPNVVGYLHERACDHIQGAMSFH